MNERRARRRSGSHASGLKADRDKNTEDVSAAKETELGKTIRVLYGTTRHEVQPHKKWLGLQFESFEKEAIQALPLPLSKYGLKSPTILELTCVYGDDIVVYGEGVDKGASVKFPRPKPHTDPEPEPNQSPAEAPSDNVATEQTDTPSSEKYIVTLLSQGGVRVAVNSLVEKIRLEAADRLATG